MVQDDLAVDDSDTDTVSSSERVVLAAIVREAIGFQIRTVPCALVPLRCTVQATQHHCIEPQHQPVLFRLQEAAR